MEDLQPRRFELGDAQIGIAGDDRQPERMRVEAALGIGEDVELVTAITFAVEPVFLLTAREEPMPADTPAARAT